MATFTKIYHSTPYATISPTRPENSASGRTVMVTGSTEGIGLAVLRAFVSAGADRVIVLSRRESALAAAREELGAVAASVAGEGKTKVEGRTVDLADGDSINALWDALKADGVAVDVLVTNAALTATGSLADDPTACWSSFEINVLANLRMVKRFLAQGEGRSKVSVPAFLANERGPVWLKYSADRDPNNSQALLNISSFMAHSNPAPGQGAYAASKAGFASALQHMAEDLDATKVQVVSIHPGAVLTAAAKRHGHTEASLPWDDGKCADS